MSHVALIVRSLVMLFLFASPALAASIAVIPTGNPTSFSVMGTEMDGVAGIQLDIAYDDASLSAPTVTQGGLVTGAMLAANTSRPGFIKMAIISTRSFSGSGQIAMISFASRKGSGGITSITSTMIDSKGSPITSSTGTTASESAAVPGITSTPGVPFSPPAQQATSSTPQQQGKTTTATTTTAASTPTYAGTVTLPTDQQQRTESQPAVPSSTTPAFTGTVESPPTRVAEQSQPAEKTVADARAEETPQRIVYKGTLDRFKQYTGSKGFSAIVALFNKKVAQSVNQSPALVLSDGQSTATLTIDLPARIKSSPNFAVNGGKLVSFKQDKLNKNRWIVDVLPESGSVKVTVTIMAGNDEFEFPLAVAPPVKTALSLDESGWNRFIKEVGTPTAPLHDFNNDGVRDYIDEFIFVANYVANKTKQPKPATAPKKPAK